ncbi:MAG: ATP synthase F1 subunit gamma [Verrucomicrobiia bacterium]|jgi:F-type H+-transporting ATPase subunit gamma
MASTRDLRRRIKSIKNTSQITKAMQMVAASKMRRAQQAAIAGRPYADLMNQALAEVTASAGDFTHPLIEKRKGAKRGILLITTDKGLCGAMNTNILREVDKEDKDKSATFACAGKKGGQFVHRTKRNLTAEFHFKDTPEFAEARKISTFVQDMFTNGEVDRVDVMFTNFISTLTQTPEIRPLLPIGEIHALESDVSGSTHATELHAGGNEFLFEPNANDVLGSLLPHYLNFQIYQMLLESKASEHSARMVAMKNATDNAGEIVKDLTLEYNKLRQAAITNELLEITTAQMALG